MWKWWDGVREMGGCDYCGSGGMEGGEMGGCDYCYPCVEIISETSLIATFQLHKLNFTVS